MRNKALLTDIDLPAPQPERYGITKEEIMNRMLMRLGRPFVVPYDHLRYEFGFRRMPGEQIMLAKLVKPSASEDELQISPDYEVHESIRKWAMDNRVECRYEPERQHYVFWTHALFERLESIIAEKQSDFHRTRGWWNLTMVVLPIEIARAAYEWMIERYFCSAPPDQNGKWKIRGLTIIEAVNVNPDFVEVL
ncbi:hypothetical protein [Paraflavitalea speifideaquila]|uniref:hypothetical protein n=1 Tax=Paraflavitalea speifideaquila TaxID=3076558 RepID=UPI0028E8A772|nr:hypothetical protein [Paraflavitalea speifideiaquila]